MSSNIEKLYNDISYNTDMIDFGKTFRDHSDRESQYIIDPHCSEEFDVSSMDPTIFALLYLREFDNSTTRYTHSTFF